LWNNLNEVGDVGSVERINAVNAITVLRLITKESVLHAIERHNDGMFG
jgi:SNF2 family DNA or RNA helicase